MVDNINANFQLAKEILPEVEIHISTQANNTNYGTYRFWHELGATRVVCARELSLEEIRQLRKQIPSDMEIETFIHGAMCISYSGRCLLSAYMTGRSANMGDCTHPCRWKYALVEETRPGEYMPVMENDRMTATEGTGGYVLSVVLTKNCPEKPPGEDYYYLGTLIKEEEDLFHVIMEYPESARSMEGNGEPGIRILDTGDEIAGLLKGRNGYTFETGEYPGNTEE